MKSHKKLFFIGGAFLALLVLAVILLQVLPSSNDAKPMEEEELLAYLAEQKADADAEEAKDLFWDPESELAE